MLTDQKWRERRRCCLMSRESGFLASWGGVHQLAGLSRLQKAVNATRSAFVLNRARGEREQQDKPSWEAPFG